MSFDQLWAGWRAGYVASVSGGAGEGEPADTDASADDPSGEHCVFCQIMASEESDLARHVVHENATTAAVLNAYPYTSGHLLVMPRRHIADFGELDSDESNDLWAMIRESVDALAKAYRPEGCNIGANIGRAAGAGIPQHLHFHVVPRWLGDTNFMTTVASVRVMPEALSDSWSKLRSAWPT